MSHNILYLVTLGSSNLQKKNLVFSILTREEHFCSLALDAMWLCENGDIVRSFKHGKDMVHLHLMKLILEN